MWSQQATRETGNDAHGFNRVSDHEHRKTRSCQPVQWQFAMSECKFVDKKTYCQSALSFIDNLTKRSFSEHGLGFVYNIGRFMQTIVRRDRMQMRSCHEIQYALLSRPVNAWSFWLQLNFEGDSQPPQAARRSGQRDSWNIGTPIDESACKRRVLQVEHELPDASSPKKMVYIGLLQWTHLVWVHGLLDCYIELKPRTIYFSIVAEHSEFRCPFLKASLLGLDCQCISVVEVVAYSQCQRIDIEVDQQEHTPVEQELDHQYRQYLLGERQLDHQRSQYPLVIQVEHVKENSEA